MVTIKQTALAIEPKAQLKNISELSNVPIDMELEDRIGKSKETGEEFEYKVVVVDNVDYRVPGKVIGDIKVLIENNPDLKEVRVVKTGEGRNTRYTVIPVK